MRKQYPPRHPRPQPPTAEDREKALAIARIYGFNALTSSDDANHDFTLPLCEEDVMNAPYPFYVNLKGQDMPLSQVSLSLEERLSVAEQITGWIRAEIEALQVPVEKVCQIVERVYARFNDGL